MLRINRISTHNEFIKYRDSWRILSENSNIDNIFLTFEWVDGCIRHFCKNDKLLILNVLDGDRLIGIAPLMIKRYRYFGLQVRSVCFIGTSVSDRMDFIVAERQEESIRMLLDYLMNIKDEWDFIDLQEMVENTKTVEAIKAWLRNKKLLRIFGPSQKSFFIEFNGNRDFLFRVFSNRLNKKLKKIYGKYRQSDLKFERYTDGLVDMDRLFSDLNAIEKESWKGSRNSGIFSKSHSRDFHREIFKDFSKKSWMDLSLLSVDGVPVAFVYNFLYRKRSYNYSVAFDKKYAVLSPGTMLMLWALKDSAQQDISEYDFVRGEGEWKTKLTNAFKMHQRVRIFKNKTYQRPLYFLQAILMPRLRKIQVLHTAWMKLKDILRWG
jgi:CelD/BcsL family acetyltransferase involved in cellulose biosynthesis